jgi:hypothetical protein
MEEPEQIRDAIRILWDKKKPIFTWALLVGICTALLSLTLKNYYKATTVFYAASPDLAKPELIFGNSLSDPEFYGSGEDLDRLLTLCHSNEIKDHLISTFDLYRHYKMDSTRPFAHHKIRKKLDKRMEVVKTKYDAIELSIEDQDKTLAAGMSNEARESVNRAAVKLITDRLSAVSVTYRASIQEKQVLLHTLNDSLYRLRKIYPIYNIEAQTESMSAIAAQVSSDLAGEQARYEVLKKSNAPRDTLMYLAARIKGLETQWRSITRSNAGVASFSLENFNEGVSRIQSLDLNIERLNAQLNEDRIRYQHAVNTAGAAAPALITVSPAEIPVYKSRPTRSLLVIAATLFSALSLSLYYILKTFWK